MSYYEIDSLNSITAAVGNWYRVKGTPEDPLLERVALWAVAKLNWRNPDTNQYESSGSELVVGLLRTDIGVVGYDYDEWCSDVAGYVELSEELFQQVLNRPVLLAQFNLLWDE